MSRAQQRRIALRKAFKGVRSVKCYEPGKVRITSLGRARASARAQGLREYPCGNHYHLTSSPDFKVSR